MLAEILVSNQSSPSRRMQLNHIQDRVSEALGDINTAYREVLVMRYWKNFHCRRLHSAWMPVIRQSNHAMCGR